MDSMVILLWIGCRRLYVLLIKGLLVREKRKFCKWRKKEKEKEERDHRDFSHRSTYSMMTLHFLPGLLQRLEIP